MDRLDSGQSLLTEPMQDPDVTQTMQVQSTLSDSDLEFLNQYLASTCFTLINVNKDHFYKELHSPLSQATLKTFATDKKQRSLIVVRIEKPQQAVEEEGKQTEDDNNFDIRFTLKVEYLGQTAHSIAFVKREAYQILELRALDNMRHLSSQLQILNLGYIGEDANIFELAVNYVEYSLIPLFSTYKTSPSQPGDDKQAQSSKSSSMQGLDNVQKDLMQLKVHLN